MTIEVLKSGYNFFLFLSNYSNFLHTILLLFYIGFVVQNLFQLQLIEQNEDQKENYNIWKLGKIYHYYKEEREEIDEAFYGDEGFETEELDMEGYEIDE